MLKSAGNGGAKRAARKGIFSFPVAGFVALILGLASTATNGQPAWESPNPARHDLQAPAPAGPPVAGAGASAPDLPAPPPAAPPSDTSAGSGATEVPSAPARSGAAPGARAAAVSPLRDLTPLGMFMAADIIVKAVMLGLVFASILTWAIWFAEGLELWGVGRRLKRAQRTLASARSLSDAAPAARTASRHVAMLLAAVESEYRRSGNLRDTAGIKERIAAQLERVEAAVGRRMMRATGIVATIGATAPFVGLFGTVWGIMNSFIGISKLHTTNLAVVAPGIAEALLATACGLAAAIPAVVIYNAFARSIARYRALFADASVDILALVSRDLVSEPGSGWPT